jgi:hypothetical protein
VPQAVDTGVALELVLPGRHMAGRTCWVIRTSVEQAADTGMAALVFVEGVFLEVLAVVPLVSAAAVLLSTLMAAFELTVELGFELGPTAAAAFCCGRLR